MITERKLVAGTMEELIEYFSFVGNDPKTKLITENDIPAQLQKLNEDGRIGYVSYLKNTVVDDCNPNDINYKLEMVGVQIRI